jgi:hypothetical protein
MANARYGSASGVDRHHEPAHRLLRRRAALMRYCHEGLPTLIKAADDCEGLLGVPAGMRSMAASRADLSCTPISCSSAIATSRLCRGDRGFASAPRSSASPISGASKNISQRSELRRRAIGVVILAAASAGRIAWKVVGIASVFPDSSSGTLLRPAWSIHGSARTPNDRLSAKIPPSEPQSAAGRPTGRTTERSRTACTSLAAMIGLVAYRRVSATSLPA